MQDSGPARLLRHLLCLEGTRPFPASCYPLHFDFLIFRFQLLQVFRLKMRHLKGSLKALTFPSRGFLPKLVLRSYESGGQPFRFLCLALEKLQLRPSSHRRVLRRGRFPVFFEKKQEPNLQGVKIPFLPLILGKY